ncbi:hypothetical protein Cni_G16412 [Canna indica]|uniref:RNase H type-1 domain-containing protein n=1 Tax=Canna indica TaxID=4628 RepID=A0AAQ3QGR6_9LILI|nr:hypothetical protein Cni_G16412 [Canna indica]
MINKKGETPWLFTGLYANTKGKKRMLLWELLKNIDSLDVPWMIAGDFNCVDKPEDKLGGKPLQMGNSLNSFKSLCLAAGFMDLNFIGPRFTWCNNRIGNQRIMARLDKAYANTKWLSIFHRTAVFHLEKVASDHRPILIDTHPNKSPKGTRRDFTFELYWFEYPEIEKFISKIWEKDKWGNKAMDNFSNCLGKLSNSLTSWSKNVIGSLENIVNEFAFKYRELWKDEPVDLSFFEQFRSLNWKEKIIEDEGYEEEQHYYLGRNTTGNLHIGEASGAKESVNTTQVEEMTSECLHKAILELRNGLKKKIGNGKDTGIIWDPWISCFPLSKWPTFLNVEKIKDYSKVSELINNGNWNLVLLRELFGSTHADIISQIYIPKQKANDKWVWVLNPEGKLSYKSAYNFLKDRTNPEISTDLKWQILWQSTTLPKIKIFAWKLLWKRLPTSHYISSFSSVAPTSCYLWKDKDDSLSHIFFNCSVSAQFWSKAGNITNYNFSNYSSWENGSWLDEGSGLEEVSRNKLIGFIAAGFWHIWKSRNSICFRNKNAGIDTLVCKALADVCDSSSDSGNPITIQSNTCRNKSLDTDNSFHYQGVICNRIFCDAAWNKENNIAGLDFFGLDKSNNLIFETSSSRFASSPLQAELWSLYLATVKAKDLNMKDIIFFSDCSMAIRMLNKDCKSPWDLKDLVADILFTADALGSVKWFHIKRTQNVKAHDLARKCYLEQVHITKLQSPSCSLNTHVITGNPIQINHTWLGNNQSLPLMDNDTFAVDFHHSIEVFHEAMPPDSSYEIPKEQSCLNLSVAMPFIFNSSISSVKTQFALDINKLSTNEEYTSAYNVGEECTAMAQCSLYPASE